ncbi:hypothetical protein CQ12_29865 [Bradyrhizobium jicamae]|uniref:Uncharacterized protein n=1 Tax=Bradyrhizobium jicamae TaxID=280332 RepID=A0A0R3M3Y3_9BRAD|nr:hypothetical protein CQ12_29865 [Bradyrhizobium jicamae]
MIFPSAAAEPAISSLVPTAISTGTPIPAASSDVISRREPRRQAASARRSERVWSAKARNVRPTGSVTSSSDGASSAIATFSPGPPPSISPIPMPPRIAERSRCGCSRARIAVMREPSE